MRRTADDQLGDGLKAALAEAMADPRYKSLLERAVLDWLEREVAWREVGRFPMLGLHTTPVLD